jgi:hypothetical protein
MCTGLEIAALVAAVGGTAASAKGAADTRKNNANAMQGQTDTSAAQFNARDNLARSIFAENSDVSKDTYNQMAKTSDEEFKVRTGLSKDAFNQLSRIQQDQVARDFAAAQQNVDQSTQIRTGRDATRDAARAQYEADVAATNAKQDQFRGQGDTVASDLVAAFTPEAMAQRRADAAAARDALVSSTGGAPASVASATADPNIRAAFERYSKAGVDRAKAASAAESNVSSYSDAMTGGNRAISKGNERTAFIRDAAGRALAPLGATLDVSALKYNDADAAAKSRYANSDADLAAALGLSQTKAAGDVKPVTDYTSAMDNAYGAFYGGKQGSIATRGDSVIGANNTQLAGTNSASQNFENNVNGITNFRMANYNSPWSTLGQFASAVAPTLLNIGQRSALSKQPAPAGTT